MLLFSTCFCLGSFAQTYLVNGLVTDGSHHPLAGITVKLSKTNVYALSDSLGKFYFQLADGSYLIQVNAMGFHPLTSKIVVDGKAVQMVLKLQSHIRVLKEVTIKSTANEERMREESLNIEIIKADFIQRNLGGSLMNTLQRLPGIKTIGIGSGQSKPLIRGLGFNRVVVVDKGIKHEGQQWGADHGLEIDQFATEEVELIKGPASFAYGADAIGGAINIKAPVMPAPNSFGGDVNLIGKSNNGLFGTSVRLFQRKERLFFDGRFTYQNYGDYRVPTDILYVYDFAVGLHKNYLRNTAGGESGIHFNAGYVTEKFKTIFYLSNTYSKSGFFANAHGLEPRRVDTELHDASARDIMMPSQQVNHFKLINRSTLVTGNHHLELELGYQRNFRQEYNHYVNHGYMPAVYPATMNIPIDLEREFDKQVYSLMAKNQVKLGKHHLQVGLNGEIQDNLINGWSFLVPAFQQKSLGLYAYDKFKVNDKLLLHGALRYDLAQLNLFSYTDWFFSETASGSQEKLLRAANLSRNFNSLVWSVGMNYNAGLFELKANVGKSFRIPIAKELGANGVNYHYFSYEKGNPKLDPEQSYQADFSVAFKTEKWQARLSPFFNYFPNYIYLNPTSAHDYFYGAGNQVFEYAESEVMRYGGEAQVKYQFGKQWGSEVLVEYLYARQLSGDKKGYTLPFSPPASALFNLTYSPQKFLGNADTYFSLDYRITSAQNNIVPPERKTAGYNLFNFQAGMRLHIGQYPLSISAQVQNVFNTRYLNHTSFYRLISLPEQGRNVVLSVKIPFNFKHHP
ncbi:iron complex outermembrane recepter protein [Pedobacter soli]|uniref:Iron complex outermembrane recepter protein n=2 Tax=Pedobacter soli TaxID=390242 RepID=A0A1G6WW39_9SPHI|nr:iron complex outermembrane recepter protein [Pedobacter soli]